MRDRLTKIKDVTRDVEHGSRDMKKTFVWCICALADEVKELKEEVSEKRNR
jgi:hypothetical protein